uniref:Putative bzip transcription factor nrf1 n=1 Tax=Corethrella appendiculata TaxID=1370023 RepID=U5EX80_9DIPT
MISYKKYYAEQLLQLALALSLLRVDPENYFELGWESRLAGTGVGGWQLEMRAAPLNEYPYANRKALMPLIEDLAHFDTHSNTNDLQAYLLNVHSGDTLPANNNVSSSTATATPTSTSSSSLQLPPQPPETTTTSGSSRSESNSTSSITIDFSRYQHLSNNFQRDTPDSAYYENYEPEDLFLNSDIFTDTESILEQNLADLSDYGEIPLTSNYPLQMLPLKNEPDIPAQAQAIHLPPIEIKRERASTSFTSDLGSLNSPNDTESNPYGFSFSNETAEIKSEIKIEETNSTTALENSSSELVEPKIEPTSDVENDDDDESDDQKPENNIVTAELTQEEMDLIEVLWKQDVDLGFTLNQVATGPQIIKQDEKSQVNADGTAKLNSTDSESPDDIEKLKALLELKNDKNTGQEEDKNNEEEDAWAGIPYTIDTETGEYVFINTTDADDALPSPLADLFLEEALVLPELIDEETVEPSDEEKKNLEVERIEEELKNSSPLDNLESDCYSSGASGGSNSRTCSLSEASDDLDLLCDMMIQTPTTHFQHPRQPPQNYGHTMRQGGYHHHHHLHHHQSRVPLTRAVSMEQRWQDIANLFSFQPGMGMGVGEMPTPHPHYPTHYPYQATTIPQHSQFGHHPHPHVLHNASLADITQPQPHYGQNLGSALSSSMHLTNSTSETDAGATGYKVEQDMMYYSNTSSELNHTADGFLNSILDEDLNLMDMACNEGMYTMRMLDHNTTSNNSSVLGGANNLGLLNTNPMHLHGTSSSSSSGIGGAHSSGSTTVGGHASASGDRLDASSDSAVSSMGSERVPSLSDGEWGDAGSDSAQDYHNNKYGGPYDYSYNSTTSRLVDSQRAPIVAQKKQHMFAKRYFQEQNTTIPALPASTQVPSQIPPTNNSATNIPTTVNPTLDDNNLPTTIKYEYEPYMNTNHLHSHLHSEGAVGPLVLPKPEDQQPQPMTQHHPLADMKYSYSIDFARQSSRTSHHDIINHNHTYTLPHGSGPANPRPQLRDKKIRKPEEEHLTRDEKRARALHIPIAVSDIINLPMDEFNERLSKYDLTETQLSLIRDIRRRGKNKVAAQNCRKRKLDQIVSLADEVKDMKLRKERLYREHDHMINERKRMSEKFKALYRHVFQNLRDPDGNPYSSSQYSLQQSADGSVVLVPRTMNPQSDVVANGPQLSHHHLHQSTQLNSTLASTSASASHSSHHHGHHHQQQQQQQSHHHQHQQQQQQSHHSQHPNQHLNHRPKE